MSGSLIGVSATNADISITGVEHIPLDGPAIVVAVFWGDRGYSGCTDYAEAIRGVSSSDASAVARQFLDPDRMVWVVVGDRAEIEDKIRELGFGEVRVLTEDLAPEPIAMANWGDCCRLL